MKFKINHNTEYQFSSEVFFEPHYFRFKPKNTPFVKVENFNLQITPKASGLTEQLDAENNFVHFCWFEGMNKKMAINIEMTVATIEFNPFNFILYPDNYFSVPFLYSDELAKILQPSLNVAKISEPLINYGKEILLDSDSKTLVFLTNLTQQIHNDFIVEYRHIGQPYSSEKTFLLKQGSCRDLAWMQIQLLRHLGFAARFVSGYFYLSVEKPEFELHAWVEVFLPGAGWIGLDPTHGIVAGNTHIPVASSSHFNNTMPVSGTVRGDANSDLITNLHIELI